MSDAVADAEARRAALDVSRSVIVQAPAGSGKTGLLVRRFLALLAGAARPETVLAITFTRKAAAEMRRRIVAELEAAAGDPPSGDFALEGYELARRAMARDRDEGWRLLDNPARLQIFTIDSLCARIVDGTPLLSRLGSTPRIAADPESLYRLAARRTLSAAARDRVGSALEVLAERSEMRVERLEEQLALMLASREQWAGDLLPRFASAEDEDAWVADVERAMGEAVIGEIAAIADAVAPELRERLHRLALRSRAAVGEPAAWPTLGAQDLLDPERGSASAWRQAAALLLKSGELRKVRGRHADVFGEDRALEADFRELLRELAEADDATRLRLLAALDAASRLPASNTFSPDGRAAVGAFLHVLRHAYAELWNEFRVRREVDFGEISARAVAALHPGETLERLDARIDHVLVDEFQDTNVSQCDLLRGLLSGWQEGDGRTLFLVGDPMQSIYRFRKAEVGLFLAARSSAGFFETTRLSPATLAVNFRSERSIVGWCNEVFSRLLGSRDDPARSTVAFAHAEPRPGAGEGDAVEIVRWEDSRGDQAPRDLAEALGLAREIGAAVEAASARGHSLRVGVLVRAREHALSLLRALAEETPSLRVRSTGLDRLRDRTSVRDLEALLRALVHPGDRLSHLAVLRSPLVGLALADLAALVEPDVAARGRSATPLPALVAADSARARASEDGRRRLERWLAVYRDARRELGVRPLALVVQRAWLRLGGSLAGLRQDALDAAAFFSLLDERSRGGVVDLDDFAHALDRHDAATDTGAEVDVDVMTIHKAKGLEFDFVVLPALTRATGGRSDLPLALETEPHSGRLRLLAPRGARGRSGADDDKYEFLRRREKRREEAELLRLLYVAATRARSRLLVSVAASRLNKDGSPRAGSLLAALAPAVDLGAARVEIVDSRRVGPASGHRLRIRPGERLAPVPASVRDRGLTGDAPSAVADERPELLSDTKKAAHVGTVFHALVERVAREGLARWDAARVEAERGWIRGRLRREGALVEEIDECIDAVADAAHAVLDDERGRWILGARPGARSEWAVSSLRGDRFVSAILDRTFVDDGVRWIVDFKTGRWDPTAGGYRGLGHDEAAARYLAEKLPAAARQLRRYRDLLAGGEGSLEGVDAGQPIRLGAYFVAMPAGKRWHDVTDFLVEEAP